MQGEAGAVLGVTAMESRDIRASTAGPGSCTTPPPSTALTSAITSYQPPVGKQHCCCATAGPVAPQKYFKVSKNI